MVKRAFGPALCAPLWYPRDGCPVILDGAAGAAELGGSAVGGHK
jgi:hypothetical protein